MDILELREEMGHKARCAADIRDKAESENRPLTAEETKDIETYLADGKALKAKIENLEAQEKLKQEVASFSDSMRRPMPRQTDGGETTENEPLAPRVLNISQVEPRFRKRYGSVKNIKGPDAELRAVKIGMWVRARLFKNQSAQQWCIRNGVDFRNVHEEGTNLLGGALVPEEMTQSIVDNREIYGVARQNVRMIPMGRDVMNVPVVEGGLTAAFSGESTLASESTSNWGTASLTAKKLSAWTRLSSEVAEDAIIDLGDWLVGELGYQFALTEDTVVFSGDGTAAHGHIVGVETKFNNDNTLQGAIDAATGNADTFAELAAVDLATVMSGLNARFHMSARWYCSHVCFDMVFSRLMAAGGGNTITDLAGNVNRSYLGYPIVITPTLATSTGSLDNVAMLLFGDLSAAAMMGERRGISISVTDQRYWDTDQIAIRATERIDVNVHDVGDGSTAGPIVALIGAA